MTKESERTHETERGGPETDGISPFLVHNKDIETFQYISHRKIRPFFGPKIYICGAFGVSRKYPGLFPTMVDSFGIHSPVKALLGKDGRSIHRHASIRANPTTPGWDSIDMVPSPVMNDRRKKTSMEDH